MAIGTVLEILTFLVIPQILLQGYYVRVMRRTVAGDDEPPEFDEWGEMLVDGIKATLISLVYFAVPLLVFLLVAIPSIVAFFGALFSGSEGGVGASLIGMLVSLLLSGALFAVFGYAGAAGLVSFADKDSIAAAFSPDILRVMLSSEYLIAYVNVIVVTVGASLLTSIVAAIPVVNLLLVVLSPFVVKYVWVVWSRLWADAYADVMEIEAGTPEPAPTATA